MNSRGAGLAPASRIPQKTIWIVCIALCAIAISLQAWVSRDYMNEDGMSYLDMAVRAAHGDLSKLINLYWSPLYPAILAAIFRAADAGPGNEFALVQDVNAVIGWLSLAAFTFFLKQRSAAHEGSGLRNPASIVLAYAVFLWSTIQISNVRMATPDLLIDAFVYLAAALVCRSGANSERHSFRTMAAAGVVLGIAAWTKAAALPLGAALLAILAIAPPRRVRRKDLLAACMTFLLLLLPLLGFMSAKAGRMTFGEAGRINYAWMVQAEIPRLFGWTEGNARVGAPLHPPRVLHENPTVYEFANTTDGTYPPWYDPSYFHEGLRVRFILSNQLRTLWTSANNLRWAQGRSLYAMLLGILFFCWRADWRQTWQRMQEQSWLFLWPIFAFAMYSVVLMQGRYVAAFLVLFWLALYDALARASRHDSAVMAAVSVIVLGFTAVSAIADTRVNAQSDFTAARQLTALGLREGDSVAIIGTGYSAYFAHLARIKIIAEVEDPQAFWDANAAERDAIVQTLLASGAKAVVHAKTCPAAIAAPWFRLNTPGYCVYVAPQIIIPSR